MLSCTFICHFKVSFIYLKAEWQWEREKDITSANLFDKWLKQLKLTPGQSQELKLHSALPCWWWGLPYLSCHPLFWDRKISRILTMSSIWDVGVSGSALTAYALYLPFTFHFRKLGLINYSSLGLYFFLSILILSGLS